MKRTTNHDYGFTPIQNNIWQSLLSGQGNIKTRMQLEEAGWGDYNARASNNLEVQIYAMRRKLRRSAADYSIKTVPGVGYRLEVPNGEGK